jgi:hypothetical protein
MTSPGNILEAPATGSTDEVENLLLPGTDTGDSAIGAGGNLRPGLLVHDFRNAPVLSARDLQNS